MSTQHTLNRILYLTRFNLFLFFSVIALFIFLFMIKFGFAQEATCSVLSDAFVHEDTPDENYGHSSLLMVGKESDGARARAYLKFSLDCIPANIKNIDEAWLRLWRFEDSSSFWITVYTVQDHWVEHLQITYNNQPNLGSPSLSDLLDDRDYILINITDIVEHWYYNEGPYNNFGIALVPYNTVPNGNALLFYSREWSDDSVHPELIVYYCTAHSYGKCYDNDVYWYDSCGTREEKKAECGSAGCSNAQCNPTTTTTSICNPHASYQCYDNDIYWYDSCGTREDKKEECGTTEPSGDYYCYDNDLYRNYIHRGCRENSCYEETVRVKELECGSDGCANGHCNTCTSHSYYQCYDNDVYWYDSCDNREEKKEECSSAGCSNGQCKITPSTSTTTSICTPHSYYECYDNNDMYWYDSCNNREDKKEECGTSGYEGSNYCYNNDVYRDYVSRGCSEDSCYSNEERRKQEECGSTGCENGKCKPQPPPTTTSTIPGICPSESIYGAHSKETKILRYIRDNILTQTLEGQEIIRLYYEWGPIIVKAIEEDEEFKQELKQMIDVVLELIEEGQ